MFRVLLAAFALPALVMLNFKLGYHLTTMETFQHVYGLAFGEHGNFRDRLRLVTRGVATFYGLALIMGLRGVLYQNIHESEVLNHPIGALSTDPLPGAPRPPA